MVPMQNCRRRRSCVRQRRARRGRCRRGGALRGSRTNSSGSIRLPTMRTRISWSRWMIDCETGGGGEERSVPAAALLPRRGCTRGAGATHVVRAGLVADLRPRHRAELVVLRDHLPAREGGARQRPAGRRRAAARARARAATESPRWTGRLARTRPSLGVVGPLPRARRPEGGRALSRNTSEGARPVRRRGRPTQPRPHRRHRWRDARARTNVRSSTRKCPAARPRRRSPSCSRS